MLTDSLPFVLCVEQELLTPTLLLCVFSAQTDVVLRQEHCAPVFCSPSYSQHLEHIAAACQPYKLVWASGDVWKNNHIRNFNTVICRKADTRENSQLTSVNRTSKFRLYIQHKVWITANYTKVVVSTNHLVTVVSYPEKY